MAEVAKIKKAKGRPKGRNYSSREYHLRYLSKIKAEPAKYSQYLAKQAIRTKRYYNTEKGRARQIERNYGLSMKEYKILLEVQNNVCAICRGLPTENLKYLSVDHNHTTGKVRGLLCQRCNRALGFVKEDVEIVSRLLEYIKKHN